MNMNRVGKFESLKILNEIDRTLIDRYGINMTDARITRFEVLTAYEKAGSVVKAAKLLAEHRGFKPIAGAST